MNKQSYIREFLQMSTREIKTTDEQNKNAKCFCVQETGEKRRFRGQNIGIIQDMKSKAILVCVYTILESKQSLDGIVIFVNDYRNTVK